MSGVQPSPPSMADRSASGGNRSSYTPSTDPHTPHLPQQQTLPLPFLPDTLELGAGDVPRTIQGSHAPTASDVGQPQQGASSSAEPFVDALPLGTAIPFTADHTPDPEWLETPGAATDP